MLLLAKVDIVLEKRYYKKNIIRSSCFDYGKMVFALLIKVITSYIVITLVNIKKIFLKKIFINIFYNYRFNFYYYTNDILYIFIYINS